MDIMDYDLYRRYPYKNIHAEAYVTGINILAVEYLVKTDNHEEYSRRIKQFCKLTNDDLADLFVILTLNRHTSSLGAMITHGEYEEQLDDLLWFLDHPEDRFRTGDE